MNSIKTHITIARIANIRKLITAITPPSGGLDQTKALSEITDVLEEMLTETEDFRDSIETLSVYAESLHESLCNIEESILGKAVDDDSHEYCYSECACPDCQDILHGYRQLPHG